MVNSKTYYFYVIYTADSYFYGGFTDNVAKRFKTHQAKKGAKFTRVNARHPLSLIYSEAFESKKLALQAEYAFKHLKRSQKEKFLKEKGVSELIWQ
ncbi:GIY-YIG nuclease family protein [Leuconostoc palmae]|uniref:GIY-YIG nuclease family protein n=1 Tax=Leuconostoc palmae TaxID=501487 RepID=UPI001C7D8733|nr:GIY-YIG nuclease family protein [Leuconostoc palmae]